MTGEEITKRLNEGRCVVCGDDIYDRKIGTLTDSGFAFTECWQHRNVNACYKPPTFDHKAERERGIQNLKKLGA